VTKPAPPSASSGAHPDPVELLKSRSYLALLVFGALIGVPVATIAYFFLKGVSESQQYLFETLPGELGFHGEPIWWPLPLLALSGFLVALAIRYLPGTGGHSPADGFKSSGPVPPIELPGIIIAAFATLSLGAVLGPEAPLIAIGSGVGVLAVHLIKRDAPAQASMVIGVAGSFAAISTLLGSPILGAFLLMEVSGLGGPLLGVVLVPGLLAAGVGSLIFVGLDAWTGFGTFSLAVPSIPPFGTPDGAELLWALGIGVAAAVLGVAIRRLALLLRPIVDRRTLLLTPVVGLAVGGLAIAFAEGSGRSSSEVLFSGQTALPSLIENAAGWTVGALVLLIVCKGLAYAGSLSSFRGGPIFPGMFLGAAGGIALSHLPGLPMIAGAAMGIGAMTAAMLGLPLTAVLLPTLILQADGLALMPLVIIAVVVSYVISARLAPAPSSAAPSTQGPNPAASAAGRGPR
jgi:H+/Cl- antiporter ClcA